MTSLFRSPPRPSINRAGYAESVPLVSPTRGAGSDDDDDGIIEDLETEVNSSKVPLKLRTSFTETLLNFIKVPFESHGHTRRPTTLETRALTRTRLTDTHLTDTNWGPRPLHRCPQIQSRMLHPRSKCSLSFSTRRKRTHAHTRTPEITQTHHRSTHAIFPEWRVSAHRSCSLSLHVQLFSFDLLLS